MNPWNDRLLSAVLGALLTTGTMYVTVVSKYVTRTEISRMIQTESPYVQDKRWIENQFFSLSSQMKDVNKKLDELLSR